LKKFFTSSAEQLAGKQRQVGRRHKLKSKKNRGERVKANVKTLALLIPGPYWYHAGSQPEKKPAKSGL
jgi:hypothetical protein